MATLAHVSDLHVSTFGDTFHDRGRMVRRSAHPTDVPADRWDVAWEEAGWRVLRERAKKGKIALVDPQGYAHAPPSRADGPELVDPVERAAQKACRLEARRAATLASAPPSDAVLEHLARTTPRNTNVRLLRAARAVARAAPDAVLITGDLTDDGDGWELVRAAFAPWAERGRLFVVPGNHDRYLFPIAGSGRPRATAESKRDAWHAFARDLGLGLDACGAWHAELDDAVIVGLDSCARPQRRFFRHNGAVGPEQLAFLRRVGELASWKRARHRLVMLHHHVVPLALGVGRGAPTELGMRLDDAKGTAECLDEIGVTLVLHGHRHVSEERQPAGCKFRLLAAPSLTLGCKTGAGPSFWRIELGAGAQGAGVQCTREAVPLDAVEQEDDPSESGEA